MTIDKKEKLNQLMDIDYWPSGTACATSWLFGEGYSYPLLHHYINHEWVQSIEQGAVARSGDKVEWEGGLFTIQEQLNRKIHVGGITALELAGFAHFLPLGKRRVRLIGEPGENLPKWFKKHNWGVDLEFMVSSLFLNEPGLALKDFNVKDFSIKISSPERAIMEVLDIVPKQRSFDEAFYLMENLMTLRPEVVQRLLEVCNSIKVKRLFMYLAEECNLPLVKKINISKIDFGKGKREIVKGGILDKKYNITVSKISKGGDSEE